MQLIFADRPVHVMKSWCNRREHDLPKIKLTKFVLFTIALNNVRPINITTYALRNAKCHTLFSMINFRGIHTENYSRRYKSITISQGPFVPDDQSVAKNDFIFYSNGSRIAKSRLYVQNIILLVYSWTNKRARILNMIVFFKLR